MRYMDIGYNHNKMDSILNQYNLPTLVSAFQTLIPNTYSNDNDINIIYYTFDLFIFSLFQNLLLDKSTLDKLIYILDMLDKCYLTAHIYCNENDNNFDAKEYIEISSQSFRILETSIQDNTSEFYNKRLGYPKKTPYNKLKDDYHKLMSNFKPDQKYNDVIHYVAIIRLITVINKWQQKLIGFINY